MTIAQEVKKIILDNSLVTFTLYGGYGMPAGQTESGKGRKTFPGGSIRNEKRNNKSRVIYSECHYSDGSYLVFRYSTRLETFSLTAFGGRVK